MFPTSLNCRQSYHYIAESYANQHVMGVLDVKMEFAERVADVATVCRVVAAPRAVQ